MKRIALILLSVIAVFAAAGQDGLYNKGALLYLAPGAAIQINGDFANAGTGADFKNNGEITVTGDLTNDQLMSSYDGKLIFKGTSAQILNGSAGFLTKDFEINNAAGVTLNTALKMDGVCNFVNGILTAGTATFPLWFTINGAHINAADASHVNGYVVKEGTGIFEYPVGNGARHQKTSVNLSGNGSGLLVKYHAVDAGDAPFGTTGASSTPLLFYNMKEYWDISPLSTAAGAVSIFWDDYNNSGIGATIDLQVAHLTGGNWLNEGSVGISGTVATGSVTSDNLTSWSPFTLGSISGSSTLPVRLINFTAQVTGSYNRLNWSMTETDAGTQFIVERSVDGIGFISIGEFAGKAGHNSYTYSDGNPPVPIAYYRLQVRGADGQNFYSRIETVKRKAGPGSIHLWPVPAKGVVTISNSVQELIGTEARIYDMSGREMAKLIVKRTTSINIHNWLSGIYLIQFADNSTLRIVRE